MVRGENRQGFPNKKGTDGSLDRTNELHHSFGTSGNTENSPDLPLVSSAVRCSWRRDGTKIKPRVHMVPVFKACRPVMYIKTLQNLFNLNMKIKAVTKERSHRNEFYYNRYAASLSFTWFQFVLQPQHFYKKSLFLWFVST